MDVFENLSGFYSNLFSFLPVYPVNTDYKQTKVHIYLTFSHFLTTQSKNCLQIHSFSDMHKNLLLIANQQPISCRK
ncbi:hypothetical protein AN213_03112 [Pseudoalteromonas sp. P1-8]|nr:hypothetical protein AN213_03112 [Pseudoalteromonas sp. P1-8]